jgi:uncharacterized protein YegJ (DUF2314 family)/tetratricopeptide (TPR) repeat protein
MVRSLYMIQVRCPECGYLQTLSEERFLSISDDFLNCPHCHSKVPKEWTPTESEAIPEEARHKMLAFSRRILNGGDVGREVVYALDSLVHHYGPSEESNKALGIGYAVLGETKKAEDFLIQARQESPADREILRSMLDVLVAQDKFREAVEVGRILSSNRAGRLQDEDVARLAIALVGVEKVDEARDLLDSHPNLDPRNALVKQARRELKRSAGSGLRALFGERGKINRLFGGAGRDSLKSLTDRAKSFITTPEHLERIPRPELGAPELKKDRSISEPAAPSLKKIQPLMEYWIYAPDTKIPRWEDIQDQLAEQHSNERDKERAFKFLESALEENNLTIDYVLKQDAEGLFDYPEELIPLNSRDLEDNDRRNLLEAKMIVRLRLAVPDLPHTEYLPFMVMFVEAVRRLTHGLVQDAVSHTLWGTTLWQDHARQPLHNLVDSHVQFELLDEGGQVWIHTHGMQKFGLLEMEMEGVPAELAPSARAIAVLLGETLIGSGPRKLNSKGPLNIPNTPFLFKTELRPPDDENHFPAGSLKILPYVSDYDPQSPAAIKHVLTMLNSKVASHCNSGRKTEPPSTTSPDTAAESLTQAVREQLLKAHKKARTDLPVFKKSFQKANGTRRHVYAVKVGFPAPGGDYEWMWVSLTAWRGQFLVGNLENTPVLRKDLHKGSRVQVSEGEIFDWVISEKGEIVEGAYTEQIAS